MLVNAIKIVSIMFFLLTLSGCFSEEKSLKVATLQWIGYESIYQAEEFGWLDKNVKLVKGNIPSDSLRRILSGEVDAATMTMEDVILARAKGVELIIVAVLDISAGADVVLSKKSILDVTQLKGKRIGSEKSALASLILIKTLEKAGLQESDVTVLDLAPPEQLDAWKKDEVDVVITYEPYASKLFEEKANYILSSRELPEMIFDVLAVRTDRIEGREDGVKKFLEAHFKALEYFRQHYKDVTYRIATREEITPEDVSRALGGVVLPSKSANGNFFDEKSSLFKAAKELNELMFEKGFITKKASLDNLLNPRFLKD